ncbi:MAG: ABC transporter permease [Trueperaceae bacterium]|nr:ABC transporter permease [Trueperaceae bacterium]
MTGSSDPSSNPSSKRVGGSSPPPSSWLERLRSADLIFQLTLLLIFLGAFAFLSFTAPNFFTLNNQLNILRQAAAILIVAVGMTFVITSAGIDLSVGSGLAVIAVLSAVTLGAGWPVWLAVVAMLALGVAIGLFNGFFIAYQGIPSFIVTLAMLSALRGVAQVITQGYSVPIDPNSPFLTIGRGRLFDIPVPALVAVAVVVIGWIVLNQTRFGTYVTGIGSNEEAVRRAGINTRVIKMAVFAISGLTMAVGGMVTAARLASGSSYTGVAFELQVIAAVIVGGTNLFGGEGRMFGTVLGTLLIAMIANGLILMNISPFYQQIIEGAIILLAIWFNTYLSGRRLEASKQ